MFTLKTMKIKIDIVIKPVLFIVLNINFISAQTKILKPFEKNGTWGFSDENGSILIACEYERVNNFKNEIAIVSNNCVTIHPHGIDVATSYRKCKQGVINNQGKLIIPIEYDSICEFSNDGITKAYLAGKVGYINRKGEKIIPFIYNERPFFRTGNFNLISLNEKVGLLSKDGKIVIPVCYDEIKATNKYYYHSDIPTSAVIQIREGDKWGFYNTINKILVTPQIDVFLQPQYQIKETETDKFIMTLTGKEVWIWQKSTGKKIIAGNYEKIKLLKIDSLSEYYNQLKNNLLK